MTSCGQLVLKWLTDLRPADDPEAAFSRWPIGRCTSPA